MFCTLLFTMTMSPYVQGGKVSVPASQRSPKTTYYDVISNLPWDVQKQGPLVCVCPLRIANGKTLEDLEMKRIPLGDITAIGPAKMVTLRSRFTDPPNLYEGLPEEAKVLYLLNVASDDQVRKLLGEGLCIDDCRGEAAAVMQSIMPAPFMWGAGTTGVISNMRSATWPLKFEAMPEAERRRVRLKVTRHIDLTVALSNGYSGTEYRPDLSAGKSVPMVKRDESQQFGLKYEVESDNSPRKSQLDFTDPRLDKKIPFKNQERLEQLLTRMTEATGIPLQCASAYRYGQMLEAGSDASARDILQALARSVAGVYRKLGENYILTNDLEGVRTHQARIAAYIDDLQKETERRQAIWRRDMLKSGRLARVKFFENEDEGLTSAEIESMRKNDNNEADGPHYLPISQASADVRKAIEANTASYGGGGSVDKSKVGIQSYLRYQFILPNGTPFWETRSVGNVSQFSEHPYLWQPPNPKPVAMPLAAGGSLQALVLRADSASTARAHVKQVQKLGLNELWLETQSPSALKAAVEAANLAGIKVALVIRPWAAAPGQAPLDPDTTTSGEHARSEAAAVANYLSLQHFYQDNSGYPPEVRENYSPLDPLNDARWSALARLAGTSGVAKIVLLDAYPTGYAQKVSYAQRDYFFGHAADNFVSYGYSNVQRLAFFKKSQTDPLDTLHGTIRNDVDFRFEAWNGFYPNGDASDDWQKARADWIRDSLQRLVNALASAGRPVLMPGQNRTEDIPPYPDKGLFLLKSKTDLPFFPDDYYSRSEKFPFDASVIDILDDGDAAARNRVADHVRKVMEVRKVPLALDFSALPPSKLDVVVSRWLRKP